MTGTVAYAAPGRINLIGEHTDYNLGFALPIALPERTVVTLTPDGGDTLLVESADEPDEVVIPLNTQPGAVTGWGAYVAGVIWALREAGRAVVGGAMSITSDVAMGSGLASSAALECAVLGAVTAATGAQLDRIEGARIAQRAENEYVGAPTGLMDQLASLCGAPRRALLMDFQSVSVQEVPFDPDAAGVALLLIDSRAPHRHAGGEYAARRRSCERAAAALGVDSLRDAQEWGMAALDRVTDPVDARRARHVFTENARVLDFVAALEATDLNAAGATPECVPGVDAGRLRDHHTADRSDRRDRGRGRRIGCTDDRWRIRRLCHRAGTRGRPGLRHFRDPQHRSGSGPQQTHPGTGNGGVGRRRGSVGLAIASSRSMTQLRPNASRTVCGT